MYILNTDEDDELLDYIESDFTFEKEPEDYSKVNQQIEILCNTELEKQILNYLYNGVEINNIAEFLNISIWKIYKRRKLFKNRYLAYVNI